MKKIAFITPHDAKYGFQLTGIRQNSIDPGRVESELGSLLNDPDIGLVIVDERLIAGNREADGLQEERLREIEEAWQGILLVLPSPETPIGKAEDYAARLIRRAIGYHVRVKL